MHKALLKSFIETIQVIVILVISVIAISVLRTNIVQSTLEKVFDQYRNRSVEVDQLLFEDEYDDDVIGFDYESNSETYGQVYIISKVELQNP